MAPLFDAWRNYNSFTRSPITPTYMEEGLPYLDRRTASTTTIAQMVSAAVSSLPGVTVDPMKIEYLATGYMGTIGGYILQLADYMADNGAARDIFNAIPGVDDIRQPATTTRVGTSGDLGRVTNWPGVGAFVQDLSQGGGYQQDFYELREMVNQAVAGINRAAKEGRLEDLRSLRHELAGLRDVRGQVRALDRYIQAWREKRDRLLRSDLPERELRRRLQLMETERDIQLAIVPFLRDVAAQGNN